MPGTLCATFPGSAESAFCFGDSGGPLAGLAAGRPVRLLGIVSFIPLPGAAGSPICGVGRTTIYTSVGRFRPWIVHVLRNRDPATSMPEFVGLRAKDTGRFVEVRARWCQTAAKGHRIRVDISVRTASREVFRGVLRGRSAGLCPEAVLRRPDRYRPGRYLVWVKIKDQSTGMVTPTPELLRGILTIRR